MKLTELVLENDLKDTLTELFFNYLDMLDPTLNESVTSDCKYKKTMKHPTTKKTISLAGIDGITDTHIGTLKNEDELDTLIKKIEHRTNILLTPSECEKAVKDKYEELNKKPAAKALPTFGTILDELKKAVKEYIALASGKPHNIKVYVPAKHRTALGIREGLSIDEIIVTISALSSFNESHYNKVDLLPSIEAYTTMMVNEMDKLCESPMYDTVKFSEYISILKWIRKQIAGSLAEAALIKTIEKFTKHYHTFVELNK